MATAAVAAAALGLGLTAAAFPDAVPAGFGHSRVGAGNGHGILLPDNERIAPYGRRTLVNNARLLSSTISPDGRTLAALSWNDFTGFLTLIDIRSGKVVQQLGTGFSAANPALGDATVAPDGPLYSADGKTLWFPQSADILKFAVQPSGKVATKPTIIATGTPARAALPSGMALSADGKTLWFPQSADILKFAVQPSLQ